MNGAQACGEAVDYRGAGGSSTPRGGYDKLTMAGDIAALLTDHLGIKAPIKLIGHDLGMLVAYAFARRFPERVQHLVLMEAPIPGTRVWNEVIPTLRSPVRNVSCQRLPR